MRGVLAAALAAGLMLLAGCGIMQAHWAVRLLHSAKSEFTPASYRRETDGDSDSTVYYRDRVIVLMYHDVSPKPLNDKSLTVDRFERQLEMMKAEGFHWITMDQYVNFVTGKASVPDNAVLLTFDDGYESFYNYAYPLLRKYGAPATNFLIVGTVGNPKAKGVPKLNWAQVREMHRNGISFFSHSYNSHAELPVRPGSRVVRGMLAVPMYLKSKGRIETEQEYDQRVIRDLTEADRVLREQVGNRYDVLAFPYGDYSPRLLNLCRKLGIQVTFTVKPGINGPGQLNGYRVNAGGMQDDPTLLIDEMKAGIPSRCMSWAVSKGTGQGSSQYAACGWGLLGPAVP